MADDGLKTVASIGFAAIGAYYGGYPGMQMGLAMGGLLFGEDDAEESDASGSIVKQSKTVAKPNPVPHVFGTALSTGNCIWFDTSYSGLYPSSFYGGMLEEVYHTEEGGGFFGGPEIEIDPMFYRTHFAVLASNLWSGVNVNNIWFDNYHWWTLLRLDDFLFQISGASYNYTRYTNLYFYSSSPTQPPERYMHLARNSVIEFKGILTKPVPQNSVRDVVASLDQPEHVFIGQPFSKFPDIKVEVSSGVPSTYAFGDRSSNIVYAITYRDNESRYSYAVTFESVYDDGLPRFHQYDHLTHTVAYLYGGDDLQQNYDDITKGYHNSQFLWRQDIDDNPDHMYFFLGRHHHWGGDYLYDYTDGVWQTHHVPYSLEYDIFYLDRSDNTIHSVIRANQIVINGQDWISDAIPPVYVQSMEVVDDEILVFGYEWQSWDVAYDYRYVTQTCEVIDDPLFGKIHRIYADWSGYPNNYWVNPEEPYTWLYFTKNYMERRLVLRQTDTYIDVSGEFGAPPKIGNKICVTKKREYQVDWGIVGEGSTRNMVIVIKPDPFYPELLPTQFEEYDRAYLLTYNNTTNDWEYETRSWTIIVDEDDTYIILNPSDPLHRDPVVGERIFFGFSSEARGRWDGTDSAYYRYFNPINEWGWDYLAYRLEEDGANPIWNWDQGPTEYNSWFNVSLHSDCYERMVILRFNKNTGAYLGKLAQFFPIAYDAGARAYDIGAYIVKTCTVSTDAQIAVNFAIVQYDQAMRFDLVINKSNLSIRDLARDRNPIAFGHAYGHQYKGAVKTYVFNPNTNSYQWRWYALLYEYVYNSDYNNLGVYLLDLGTQGIFPYCEQAVSTIEGVYSSILAIGVEATGLVKWYRGGGFTTGPLYTSFYLDTQSTRADSPQLRRFDFDNKLIFTYANSIYPGADNETWVYFPANEYNKVGYAYPLSANWDFERWGKADNDIGKTIRNCLYACSVSGDDVYSYQCDANPSSVIAAIMDGADTSITKYISGLYIPISSFEHTVFTDSYVPAQINYAGRTFDIVEREYGYSKSFEVKRKALDHIQDVLDTFQGFLYECPSTSNDLYSVRLKVPHSNETISYYFGFQEETFTTNALSNEYDVIFIDLSDYPDDYWNGDYGQITIGEDVFEFLIIDQDSTGIRLYDDLPEYASNGASVLISKQSIKEGTFTFARKSKMDKINKLRIEFVNRLMGYKIDVVEADDHYRQDIYDKETRTKQMDMHGICRATQASRMAYRYLDYEQYVNWLCSFETDLLGFALCVGDIIGITHPITGWFAKPFRVKSIDELEDFESRIELEEYVKEVYHSYSQVHIQGLGGGSIGTNMNPNVTPFHVRRLYAHYDYATQRVYVTFYSPVENNFWIGAKIYISVNGSEYAIVGTAFNSSVTPNVIFSSTGTGESSEMEATITKYCEDLNYEYIYTEIPYEPSTLLGTFPASGYIWVNQELIYYNGIDTVNNKFTGCVRCVEVPDRQYAVDAPDDYLSWTNPLITLANYNSFSFPVTSSLVDLTAEQAQTEGSQIEYDQPVINIKAVSLSAYGADADFNTAPYYRLLLAGPVGGRPYSPTLLRYERNI